MATKAHLQIEHLQTYTRELICHTFHRCETLQFSCSHFFFYKNRINLHHYQLTKRKKEENNHNFAKTFHYKESLMYFIF